MCVGAVCGELYYITHYSDVIDAYEITELHLRDPTVFTMHIDLFLTLKLHLVQEKKSIITRLQYFKQHCEGFILKS